jgi:tRNA threonylcarbamoyladenosine biosynthesis protein TsaE
VGGALARALPEGAAISLEGPLGAGKTVLVRGFCDALGVRDRVTSPSYTLWNEYETERGRRVIHLDAFRLAGASELEDLGFEDRRDPRGFLLVEWGDRAVGALPGDVVRVSIEPDPEGDDVRRISFRLPEGVAAGEGLGAGESP